MKFGFIWMPETVKASGCAVNDICYHHSAYFRDILDRYAAKIGQPIPKDEDAQLIFVKDAIADFTKFNSVHIKDDEVIGTIEIFNWDVIDRIIDRLNQDSNAIAKDYYTLSKKFSKDGILKEDCACSAYALGMISLEELYSVVAHYCDYDHDYCKRDLTPEELAVSVFCRIANSFSLKSEYFDYDYDPIEYNTIGLIEKILADVIVMDTDRLPFILS
jgi:hypothetical protein